MSERDAADVAWLAYRDQAARERPWCDQRRLARQMRKRDFIAGFLAATTDPASVPGRDGLEGS